MRLSRHTLFRTPKLIAIALLQAICLLVYASSVLAGVPVPSFKAEYRLKHNGIEIGRVTLAVKETSPQHHTLTSTTETSGLLAFVRKDDVVETSEFTVVAGKLRPLNYHYSEQLGDGVKDVNLIFDWPKKRVTNRRNGDSWRMAISDGVIDKALMQIALMMDLSQKNESLSYQVADGGRLKTYQFKHQGFEKIRVNEKDYQTIKLARTKDDKPLITHYWCAPSLHMLPVLLTRKKSYGTFSMELLAAVFENPASKPAKTKP